MLFPRRASRRGRAQSFTQVKRDNRLKFNSHEWFFKGVCRRFEERMTYAFLTDAGTGFDRNCLRHLVAPTGVDCFCSTRVEAAL